jgi:hypothetical protein
VIRCVPDEGRVGAGERDPAYAALGFRYVATFRVLAAGTTPFRREMWTDGETSLTIGPSGLSGSETAFHTVGGDGTIVRTFSVDPVDAGNLPRRLGVRASGLNDEVMIGGEPSALHLRHLARVGQHTPGPRWPLRVLDDELRLSHRTSTLLAISGRNMGTWLLRLISAFLAGCLGTLLGACGLPPRAGWMLTGGAVSLAAALGLWLLVTRRWTPGPLPARTSPETWPLPVAFGPRLEREVARGPIYKL